MTGKLHGFNKKRYAARAMAAAERSPLARDTARAFFTGGGICASGELLLAGYRALGMPEGKAGLLVTVTLIFLAAALTALGWFDRLARFAGAGTLVPVTGFANAVASPAIDTRSEGLVMGVGAKIFTVAGPVLLYGTLAGAAYGVILSLVSLF